MNLRLTIRAKLFLSILLAILVSYSILLFLTVRNIEASLDDKISRDLEANLSFVRYQMFTRANQIKYSLLVPASRPRTKEYLQRKNKAELSGILSSIKQALPFLSFAAFVSPDGKVLASLNDRPGGYPFELQGLSETAFSKRGPILSCELAPPTMFQRGGQGMSAPAGTDDAEKTDESLLVAAVAIPITDDDGRVLGALISGVPVTKDTVIPYRLQEALGSDLHVTFTQRSLKPFAGSGEDFDFPTATVATILPVLAKGRTYRGEVRIGETPYKVAFEPIHNVRGELIGSLSVALSRDYFNKMRMDRLGGIIASTLFGTLFSLLIAFFASRHFAVPLKELTRGVQCIEAGNLDYRTAIETSDEFGILASSFNRMADALRERDTTIKNKTFDLEVLNRCLHEMNELLESNVRDRTAELEMEKGRLEAILSSMAEGVVVTDRENRVILFNSAAQKIFGIAPYKVISRHVDQIDLKSGFHQLIESIRETGTGDHLVQGEKEVTIDRKKLRVSLSPLLDKSWEFAGVVMSIRDVTHEEEVDRMKTEFISTVSHELKTPLTSMKGSLQVILGRGEGLTETERELIQVCLRNTDRLIRLISDILDISRIESGRVETNLKSESMDNLITCSIEEITSYARAHGVSVVNAVEDDLPPVLADHDRLIQVLTNLLSNAIKFSPAGKSVTVKARRDGDFLAVSVHDEGKAIERVDRKKLFQRFPQLVSSEAVERGGTGLGLAICREIIERHHGSIYYQAGNGGGNVFSFRVPVCGET
ncbi:MAG: HAMP domain-containing protein [Deltaproteobacteria bacterium]|nr:HAMP domain-containing protein [Deltaproteobacteria bacterium]